MRISLITPSYQQAAYLEECIASVHGQSASVEHIVVDGGSTDGSKEIIERQGNNFAWWCSEKDQGQSDAINKGLAHATGDIFGWLNSDDALLPSAVVRVTEAFAADPELLVFGGRVTHRDANGERVFERINGAGNRAQLFCDPVINQPATFYRMSAVRAIGGVDPALRYVMDVELWWQLLFRYGTDHLRFEAIELAMFRMHGASKTMSEHSGFLREQAAILHGLCERTSNKNIADVIAIGYPDRPVVRGIAANEAEHHGIVRDMSVHFLLKWHGLLHNEQQFHMMRALYDAGIVRVLDLHPMMGDRWIAVSDHVAGNTWNGYRFRRKLKHLFG